MSGNLIGKGFYTGKYKENGQYTLKSILKFYTNRFIKIGIPTWIVSIVSVLLLEPKYFFDNKGTILHILTFTYKNVPASNMIGSTWYVSTLMWLYLCAPFLMLLLEKTFASVKNRNRCVLTLYICVIISGMLIRLGLYKLGLDWSSNIYVPFYCNLDLYIGGMLANFIQLSSPKKTFMPTILIILIGIIIVNTRIYYESDFNAICLVISQYIFPSIYICIIPIYICQFTNNNLPEKAAHKGVLHNLLKFIEIFSNISFEFYLTHCIVLNEIAAYINPCTNVEFMHINLIIYAFLITFTLSLLLHYCFYKMPITRQNDNTAY